MPNTNKQLQIRIGELIGKDFFKLEFGCRIVMDNTEYIVNEDGGLHTNSEQIYHNELETYLENYGDENVKILGFEPTPLEYLLALSLKTGEEYCLTSNGKLFYNPKDGCEIEYLGIEIFLTLSLFNQSEDTKIALLELLNK